jgi:hypothetical protein
MRPKTKVASPREQRLLALLGWAARELDRLSLSLSEEEKDGLTPAEIREMEENPCLEAVSKELKRWGYRWKTR